MLSCVKAIDLLRVNGFKSFVLVSLVDAADGAHADAVLLPGQKARGARRFGYLFHFIFILLHTLLQLQTQHEEKCHKLADKFQSLNWSVSRRGELFEG